MRIYHIFLNICTVFIHLCIWLCTKDSYHHANMNELEWTVLITTREGKTPCDTVWNHHSKPKTGFPCEMFNQHTTDHLIIATGGVVSYANFAVCCFKTKPNQHLLHWRTYGFRLQLFGICYCFPMLRFPEDDFSIGNVRKERKDLFFKKVMVHDLENETEAGQVPQKSERQNGWTKGCAWLWGVFVQVEIRFEITVGQNQKLLFRKCETAILYISVLFVGFVMIITFGNVSL